VALPCIGLVLDVVPEAVLDVVPDVVPLVLP
jgi:hypothetical protein